jgi:hypothetical protein
MTVLDDLAKNTKKRPNWLSGPLEEVGGGGGGDDDDGGGGGDDDDDE